MSSLWGAADLTIAGADPCWIRACASSWHRDSIVVPSGACVLGSALPSRHYDSFTPGSRVWPHLSIAADVQLHNRCDVLRVLGSAKPESANPDDAELLLAAYVKWGEECPNFLLGEFSFAIWDERLKSLFCCRDHIGFRAFLYWRNQTRFVFASDIEPILACPGVPREINRRKVAGFAVSTAFLATEEETFHSGIFSLPPGVSMTVGPNGVRRRRYWELKPSGGPAVPKRPDDAFEALREILFQAVECRLDRDYPVAAMLSGGLDSSGIVSVAARCLEKQNRQLTAIAGVLPEESRARFADERDYIDEFRSWPNIRIKYVTATGRGPFDSLSDASRFAASPLRSSRSYLDEEIEKVALADGARTLLWGVGGEFGVTSWSERYYLELAVRLRWLTLLRGLNGCRSSRDVSPLRMVARQSLAMLFPLRGKKPAMLLTRDFQRECRDKPIRTSRSPYQRRYQLDSIRVMLGKHALSRGQTVRLLPVSSPLIDKRILEFCLALPIGMDVRDGYHRYPIRAALKGILPPRIQWRADKTPFSPDYFARYNTQLGMALEFVAGIRPNDPVRRIVDVERLRKMLVPVDTRTRPAAARDEIPLTLYLINFLRQFSEFRP